MLGANGVKVASKTLWKGNKGERIDVENPAPGRRPGQIHYQDTKGNKYLYDPTTHSFPGAPHAVNNLLTDPKFQTALNKGLTNILVKSEMPMQLNTLMRVSYAKASNWNSLTPPKELKQLVHSGFIEVEGCCFLKYLYHKETNVSPADFPDKTGLECFINSFHLEDYVEDNWLLYALWLINQLFDKYAKLFNHKLLTAIVTQDDLSCTLRFHLKREGESWLDEDLESYQEEAILVIDSNERPSLGPSVVSRTKTKRNVPLLVEQPVWLKTG